jgi:hypothetical protein
MAVGGIRYHVLFVCQLQFVRDIIEVLFFFLQRNMESASASHM